ncbi:MAG: DNA replication protein DnaD, partial [Bacteroidales bacterium]|nr:DNA replication protein DnaD [Bacteroidales bacterium]
MAERRMFAKTIIDSDVFLEMPMSARLLYYDLAMRADDDGFINSPRKIMKFVGATNDDMNILIARKFIIPFDNGVVVIKHWRIHNYIRKDTYNETSYKEQKALLELDENKAYRLSNGFPVDGSLTQVRIGKDSIDKDSINNNIKEVSKDTSEKKIFTPPSVEEVQEYIKSVGSKVDAEAFVAFYESKGWMIGKNKMKSWKSAIVTWEKRNGLKRETPKKVEVEICEEIY